MDGQVGYNQNLCNAVTKAKELRLQENWRPKLELWQCLCHILRSWMGICHNATIELETLLDIFGIVKEDVDLEIEIYFKHEELAECQDLFGGSNDKLVGQVRKKTLPLQNLLVS